MFKGFHLMSLGLDWIKEIENVTYTVLTRFLVKGTDLVLV